MSNLVYFKSEYREGYDAACLCEPFDPEQSEGWRKGWEDANRDISRDWGIAPLI
jgi:hypothetical protein